jgi:hypothetical protein
MLLIMQLVWKLFKSKPEYHLRLLKLMHTIQFMNRYIFMYMQYDLYESILYIMYLSIFRNRQHVFFASLVPQKGKIFFKVSLSIKMIRGSRKQNCAFWSFFQRKGCRTPPWFAHAWTSNIIEWCAWIPLDLTKNLRLCLRRQILVICTLVSNWKGMWII